ncbi:hypothetical protein N658DRAFT_497739 [Parathielavia hyrcaniae]|uniref:Uncharacterized protein n=1 Tax=Parathielavia hyrcaniae TaxID=113614 RepID=A0AAN6PXY7_9PEZI|nr:hypothetical protein N658DRAFT_497739 [Parathielavia hyrcaniae]
MGDDLEMQPPPNVDGNDNLNDELLEFIQGFADAIAPLAAALENENDEGDGHMDPALADQPLPAINEVGGTQNDEQDELMGPNVANYPLLTINGNIYQPNGIPDSNNGTLQWIQQLDAGTATPPIGAADRIAAEGGLIDLYLADEPLPAINGNGNGGFQNTTQFTQEFDAASAAAGIGAGNTAQFQLEGGDRVNLDIANLPIPPFDVTGNGNLEVGNGQTVPSTNSVDDWDDVWAMEGEAVGLTGGELTRLMFGDDQAPL